MKRITLVITAFMFASLAFQSNAFGQRCLSSPTLINGPSTMSWQAGQQSYSSQIICDAVEYEWTLNVDTSCPASQLQPTPNVLLDPYDFGFLHNAICGTWTISVRARVDDGVNPPYWTAYVTKTVTVTGCP